MQTETEAGFVCLASPIRLQRGLRSASLFGSREDLLHLGYDKGVGFLMSRITSLPRRDGQME